MNEKEKELKDFFIQTVFGICSALNCQNQVETEFNIESYKTCLFYYLNHVFEGGMRGVNEYSEKILKLSERPGCFLTKVGGYSIVIFPPLFEVIKDIKDRNTMKTYVYNFCIFAYEKLKLKDKFNCECNGESYDSYKARNYYGPVWV